MQRDHALGLVPDLWPSSRPPNGMSSFKSSTECFAWLHARDQLNNLGVLAWPATHVEPARRADEFEDGKLHNVWCVTLDIDGNMKAGVPVLFTQNFKFKSRGQDATLDQMIGLEPKARPYGDEAGIVIMRGGGGLVLDAKTATQTNFNPTGATNRFLWPLAAGQDVSGR